jgi:hypothetical protein
MNVSLKGKSGMKGKEKQTMKIALKFPLLHNADMTMPHHQQQMYMTPPQMHPQLMGGAPYYVEESTIWSRYSSIILKFSS